MSEREEDFLIRFQYFVDPIRDLQKNWDIDFASLLEDFNKKIIDLRRKAYFAEAGIVVEACTNVYSRKVEYVYGTTFVFLDQLRGRKPQEMEADIQQEDNDEKVSQEPDPCDLLNESVCDDDWEDLVEDFVPKNQLEFSEVPTCLESLADFEKANKTLTQTASETGNVFKKDDFFINTGCFGDNGVYLFHPMLTRFSHDSYNSSPFERRNSFRRISMIPSDNRGPCANRSQLRALTNDTVIEVNRRRTTPIQFTAAFHDTAYLGLGSDEAYDDDHTTLVEPTNGFFSNSNLGFINVDELEKYEGFPVESRFSAKKNADIPFQKCSTVSSREKIWKKKRERLGLPSQLTLEEILDEFYIPPTSNDISLSGNTGEYCPLIVAIFGEEEKAIKAKCLKAWKEQRAALFGEKFVEKEASPSGTESSEAKESGEDTDEDEEDNLPDVPNEYSFADVSDEELTTGLNVTGLFDVPELEENINKPPEQLTFAELLHRHLHKYWEAIRLSQPEQLKRQHEFQAYIENVEKIENGRRPFDMSQYGRELLDQFPKVGDEKSFIAALMDIARTGVVIDGDYAVSRYILALLIMLNHENFEVVGPVREHDFNLKLLKAGQISEIFESE